MENAMSKEADALLRELLDSRIDAAGFHCSKPPPDEPEPGDPTPGDEEPC
jgi:hypothetical protein